MAQVSICVPDAFSFSINCLFFFLGLFVYFCCFLWKGQRLLIAHVNTPLWTVIIICLIIVSTNHTRFLVYQILVVPTVHRQHYDHWRLNKTVWKHLCPCLSLSRSNRQPARGLWSQLECKEQNEWGVWRFEWIVPLWRQHQWFSNFSHRTTRKEWIRTKLGRH